MHHLPKIKTFYFSFFTFFLGNAKGKRENKIVYRTRNHLNLYAAGGLRTLCIAKKVKRINSQFNYF